MGLSKNSICDFGWKAPACFLISACAFCNQLDQSLMALGRTSHSTRHAGRSRPFAIVMAPARLK